MSLLPEQGFNFEGYFEASDDLKLHYLCRQTEQPRYQIIGVHGLGEHAARYAWFADQIADDGGSCCFLDLRGHGLSDGPRGHSASYEQLLSDIETFVTQQKLKQIPAFFFGHSLGGGLAINYALKLSSAPPDRRIFTGIIASSPLLKLSFQPPAWKLFLAKLLVRLWPSFSLDRDVDPQLLTRDAVLADAYRTDPATHELVSAAMFSGFVQAGESALATAPDLGILTLVLHGEADQVTDIGASKKFAQSAGEPATFISFPGCYHELINEINRDQAVGTIKDWINRQL